LGLGAHATLTLIVEREAGKLLTLSQASSTFLSEDQLAAVERLARAVKYLGAPTEAPSDPADHLSAEEALALVEGAAK